MPCIALVYFRCAVTSIKIDCVLHEFSTIPCLKEDVNEIVLNVKGIIAKTETRKPKAVVIDVVGKRDVTDADIKSYSDLVILNRKHHIATVSDVYRFYMELTFKQRNRYVRIFNVMRRMSDRWGLIGMVTVIMTGVMTHFITPF